MKKLTFKALVALVAFLSCIPATKAQGMSSTGETVAQVVLSSVDLLGESNY